MGDSQLAPSSPSSGLSNGTKRLRERSMENSDNDSQASTSSLKLDSFTHQTPSNSHKNIANGVVSVNLPSARSDQESNVEEKNGGTRTGKTTKSFNLASNGTLNRLKDSQMRSSAPPSSSSSKSTTKPLKRSAQANNQIESESSAPSDQSGSHLLDRMRSIRQTRSTSPLQPLGSTENLSTSALDVENLALSEKEQNLFRVRALDDSSQILPPPPRLPFDPEYPGLATNGLDAKGNPIPIKRRDEIAKQLTQMNKREKNLKQSPIREIKTEEDGQSVALDSKSRESSLNVPEIDQDSSVIGNEDTSQEGGHDDAALSEPKGSLIQNSTEDNDLVTRESFSENGDLSVKDHDSSKVGENGQTNRFNPEQTSSSKPSSSRSNRRKRQSEIETLDQSYNDTSVANLSIDSANSASSRRPREAHKRLKMNGGYYGKNAKPPSPPDSLAERLEEPNDAEKEGAEMSAMDDSQIESRAASSALEEVGPAPLTATTTMTTVDEDLLAQAIAADASFTTPIKASQQPSMTINLRNSASKGQSTKMVHAGSGLIDNGGENNEHCETCNGAGHFICCDGCPRSFHFACIDPPMDVDELPNTMDDEEDKWYCNVCKAEKQSIKSEKPNVGKGTGSKIKEKGKSSVNGKGAAKFQPLLTYIERTNPTIFSLPLEIRNYFKGVATAADGTYVDSNMLRPLKINRLGVVEERDPLRLKDKNGKLILCFRCGESALPSQRSAEGQGKRTNQPRRSSPRKASAQQQTNNAANADHTGWRKIISCDFCALHWHLDCLEPPMANMPSLSRKWLCPAHVDHAVRSERIPKSIANSTTVHDLPIPSEKSVGIGNHYRTRVVNDGRIDIIPDPMDTYFVTPQSSQNDKPGKHQEEKNMHSLASSVSGSGDQRGRGFDRGWEDLDIPNSATSFATNTSQRTIGSSSKNLKFKYRIPEKVIRLDFWSKAEIERERAFSRFLQQIHQDMNQPLDVLASIANAESLAIAAPGENNVEAIGEREAKERVEQIFGSQYARTLFPSTNMMVDTAEDQDSILDGIRESGLRQTFVSGEYEKEFNERSSTMIAPHLTPSAAVTKLTDQMREAKIVADRLNAESSASALEVDVEELSKLRAIKSLVDRKGAKALLNFLLDEERDVKDMK